MSMINEKCGKLKTYSRYSKANANVGPKEKASILAQYVERKTSGGAQNETPQQHDYYYGYHVATLKVTEQ